MQWADDITIETPEQIDVSLEVAGLGSRFLARIVDWGIKWGILAVIGLLVAIVLALMGVSAKSDGSISQVLLGALFVGLFYFFLLGFDIYFEFRHNGQTPGKRHVGIRVIRESGAPLDFRSACIRNLLALADFLPGFYLFGAFLVLLTSRHQRLGDMAAGTLVIRDRVVEAPPDILPMIEKLASPEFSFTADQLAPCVPNGHLILRSFFQRRSTMDSAARSRLASLLGKEFINKTNYPLAVPVGNWQGALVFLASLYRDLENLKQHGR